MVRSRRSDRRTRRTAPAHRPRLRAPALPARRRPRRVPAPPVRPRRRRPALALPEPVRPAHRRRRLPARTVSPRRPRRRVERALRRPPAPPCRRPQAPVRRLPRQARPPRRRPPLRRADLTSRLPLWVAGFSYGHAKTRRRDDGAFRATLDPAHRIMTETAARAAGTPPSRLSVFARPNRRHANPSRLYPAATAASSSAAARTNASRLASRPAYSSNAVRLGSDPNCSPHITCAPT